MISVPRRRNPVARLPCCSPCSARFLAATLAPILGQQAGVATWMILSVQGLALAGLLALVVAMVRVRSR